MNISVCQPLLLVSRSLTNSVPRVASRTRLVHSSLNPISRARYSSNMAGSGDDKLKELEKYSVCDVKYSLMSQNICQLLT